MTTSSPAPNSRASLLAGLRTGGVRSVSGPVPHTASPAGTFNVPRYPPTVNNDTFYEEEDELADMISQKLYVQNNVSRMQQVPMTAAVDGGMNRFAMQQTIGMNGGVGMNPYVSAAAAQSQMQAVQMQMMQLELARLQAQQYQAELIAQAQFQRSTSQPQRRTNMSFVPPASAGPANPMFDMRAAAMGAQARRANQADQLRAMLGIANEEQVPMTAALGGRFGSRIAQGQYEEEYLSNAPVTPNYTNVLSGGAALGNGTSNSHTPQAPSKSDSAVSWRRGGNNSVLSGNRTVSSPLVKITPPPTERTSPSPASSPLKTRPPALRFTPATSQPLNAVAVDLDGDGDDSSSVSSSKSGSTPSTPRTASSLSDAPPLSPREEATKKLYEGLGIGRQVPTIAVSAAPPTVQRLVAQPIRQPRGPPSSHDETLPKNFATRSRRKAIGALGALLDAREKREGGESA